MRGFLLNKQADVKGFVLITGLIFLMLLTIIGITSMSNSAVTEKMTQNMRETSISFVSAEAALGDGEAWIKNQTNIPVPVTTCSSTPCQVWQFNALGNFTQQPDSWWQTQGKPFSSSISNVVAQPVYLIEQYIFVPYDLSPDTASRGNGYYFYRVTSRGFGATNTSHAVVQSIYATQYN